MNSYYSTVSVELFLNIVIHIFASHFFCTSFSPSFLLVSKQLALTVFQPFSFQSPFSMAVKISVLCCQHIISLFANGGGSFQLCAPTHAHSQVHPCISIKHVAFHQIQNRQSLSPGCHALIIVLLSNNLTA